MIFFVYCKLCDASCVFVCLQQSSTVSVSVALFLKCTDGRSRQIRQKSIESLYSPTDNWYSEQGKSTVLTPVIGIINRTRCCSDLLSSVWSNSHRLHTHTYFILLYYLLYVSQGGDSTVHNPVTGSGGGWWACTLSILSFSFLYAPSTHEGTQSLRKFKGKTVE